MSTSISFLIQHMQVFQNGFEFDRGYSLKFQCNFEERQFVCYVPLIKAYLSTVLSIHGLERIVELVPLII